MAWRINDVDFIFFSRIDRGQFRRPETSDRGGGDSDAALALLFHPVGHGLTLVHCPDLVNEAGVIEDGLGNRGFAGINVSNDTNIPSLSDG